MCYFIFNFFCIIKLRKNYYCPSKVKPAVSEHANFARERNFKKLTLDILGHKMKVKKHYKKYETYTRCFGSVSCKTKTTSCPKILLFKNNSP